MSCSTIFITGSPSLSLTGRSCTSLHSFLSHSPRAAPIASSIVRPDLIIAADCVYFEPAFPLLVQTLSDLADLETEILFAYKKRRKVIQSIKEPPVTLAF